MDFFGGAAKKALVSVEEENRTMQEQIGELKAKLAIANDDIAVLTEDKSVLAGEKTSLQRQLDEYTIRFGLGVEEETKLLKKLGVLRQQVAEVEQILFSSTEKKQILCQQVEELNKEYVTMDEVVLLQSFGLYSPQYSFATSIQYKERLGELRNQQEKLVTSGNAAHCLKIWTVDNNAAKGKKWTDENVKQVLRSFNIECDSIIEKVKFSNYDASKKRIRKTFTLLNKLNDVNQIILAEEYLELKYQELALAFEYAQKRQEEKEELRQQREARKEEARLAKELEEKRLEVEKEQQHYQNAMQRLKEQMEAEQNQERLALLKAKELEILQGLDDVDKALQDLDYRQANQRAGYVYIISNLGAFGENVYKIGMTRRLDPQDRVDELGGASVPFRFDVHALIFSDDAPKLEAALHHAFETKKVNAVNGRKEFFRVTLEEIEAVVKANHDKSVDFVKYPEAQQYRESLNIVAQLQQ